MVETDLQSAIGGLSEEGRSNAGVCVCALWKGREGGRDKEESKCCSATYFTTTQPKRLKVILRVIQNHKTTFTLPHNADVM